MKKRNCVTWDEVSNAAYKMFDVWVRGFHCHSNQSAYFWARGVWDLLIRGDLAGKSNVVEETETKIRLLSLSLIYRDFCMVAWEERIPMSVCFQDKYLNLNDVAIGIVAAKVTQNNCWNPAPLNDLRSHALQCVAKSQRAEIFECISECYGTMADLCMSMVVTNPACSNLEDEDTPDETHGWNIEALDFVRNGFTS